MYIYFLPRQGVNSFFFLFFLVLLQVTDAPTPVVRQAVALEGFQVALIVLAGIIVIMGLVGICYICVQWKRYVCVCLCEKERKKNCMKEN